MNWGLGFLKSRRRSVGKKGPHYKTPQVTPHCELNTIAPHWTNVPIEAIPIVPGMTLEDELKYFYWCCATIHRPGNRVVELGPYVGRSTMAMAAGLRSSADPHGKMVTIDRFQWEPYMLKHTIGYTIGGLSEIQRARLTPAQQQPRVGDSYLPIFNLYTESHKDSIEAVDTALENYKWTGEPIDVLMIDAAKSWAAFDQIIREFFPCLVDGAAVIHQDYKHAFTYWLHPVSERMVERGVLSVAENVYTHPSQGFRFHKTPNFRVGDYLRDAFTVAEMTRLMDRSVAHFQNDFEKMTAIGAKCLLLKAHGQIPRAKDAFEKAVCEGGFADTYPLFDLLKIARDWHRLLTSTILERATARTDATLSKGEAQPKLRPTGMYSVAIPVAAKGHSNQFEVPELDTNGASALALNFWADKLADEAVSIRVQVTDIHADEPFYDKEIRLNPGAYQPAVVPLAGRTDVALRWTTSSETPLAIAREIHCIIPMLFKRA